MGFPAGGFNIIIPVFSCDQSFVCSVKIPKQSSKGRSHIVGKARHKLAVGFFCLPYNRKSAFIGHNDLIDFIGKRRCQFICCRQNTPVAISVFHINQCIGHFCDLLFYAPNENDGSQYSHNSNHNGQEYDNFHADYTSLLNR